MARNRDDQIPTVVLGLPFTTGDMQQTLDLLESMIKERSRNIVVTPNLDHVVRSLKDPIFKHIEYTASLVMPDGMPLVWAGKLLRPRMTERVAGSDLIPKLIERAADRGYSVFFLGGTDDAVNQAAHRCQHLWPNLKVAGAYSPKFAPVWDMENDEIVRMVNASGADILLVAFGEPKQSYWISMNRSKLEVPVAIGVGGTIDFLSGRIPRAPEWMKKICAEWIFRLSLEPRRLAKRYAVDLRDGVFPLFLQTLADNLMRLLPIRTKKGDGLQSQRFSANSYGKEVRVLMMENCKTKQLALLRSCLDVYLADVDALILDLRSLGRMDSETIAYIVSIDKRMREDNKHLLLITVFRSEIGLRIARLHGQFHTVRTQEDALHLIELLGKKRFSVKESTLGSISIIRLQGELTLHTASAIGDLRQVLALRKHVLVDLSSLTKADPGGLRELWDVWREIRNDDEPMRCIGGKPRWQSYLRSAELGTRFVLYATQDEAIRSFRAGLHASLPDTASPVIVSSLDSE